MGPDDCALQILIFIVLQLWRQAAASENKQASWAHLDHTYRGLLRLNSFCSFEVVEE